MAVETFAQRYFIAAPAAHIYDHLAAPTNYVGLSPLVVDVRDVQTSRDQQGREVQRYLSVERFHFLGFIRYDNLIRVTTTLTQPPAQLISEVDSPGWVHMQFVFDFQPDAEGTWIEETVTAQAPLLLRRFVVAEAQRVQQALARILTTRMEELAG